MKRLKLHIGTIMLHRIHITSLELLLEHGGAKSVAEGGTLRSLRTIGSRVPAGLSKGHRINV